MEGSQKYNVYLQAIDQWASEFPKKEAIVDRELRIGYRRLKEDIDKLASAMAQNGIGRDDVVITVLPNCYELVLLCFACARLGAIFAPCNGLMEPKELHCLLKTTKAKSAFVSRRDLADACAPDFPDCQFVAVRFRSNSHMSLEDMITSNPTSFPFASIDARNNGMIIFTSGSSGTPKGCELSFYNVSNQAKRSSSALHATADDVYLAILPLHHYFGLCVTLLEPLRTGGKVIIMQGFFAGQTLDMIVWEGVTVVAGVPTMYVRLLQEQRSAPRNTNTLRACYMAGAICEAEVVHSLRETFHCGVVSAYGATELGISCTTLDDDPVQSAGTCGRIFDDVQIRILDKEGKPVAPGNVGTLFCNSPFMFRNYFNAPELTRNKFTEDGWLITNDYARLTPEGHLVILGRADNAIIRGGENIFPLEIEQVYRTCPGISNISVLGINDKEMGQRICAFVVLKPGAQYTVAGLQEYALGRLAKNKIPEHIIFLDEIPLLNTGKVHLGKLKELAAKNQ